MLHRLSTHEALSADLTTQIKLFADGASLEDFTRLHQNGQVAGFTTNPTLMRKAASLTTKVSPRRCWSVFPTRRSPSRSSRMSSTT